jgi:hypothetical protein
MVDNVDWEVEHGRQRRARMAAEKICRQVIGDALGWKQKAEALQALLADAPHAIQPPGCDYEATKTADHPLPCSCWKAEL